MLIRHLFTRSRPQAPMADAAGSHTGALAAPATATLDPQALQRLRELDPTGASQLIERVGKAFNTSVARLVPQLRAAQAAADAAGIRHVAHTLKSSSASIGAVKLSRLCAEMEAMARQGETEGMHEQISALCIEIDAVLDALKYTLDCLP